MDFCIQILQHILFAARSVAAAFGIITEVSVLCYHGIDESGWNVSVRPDRFKRQMQYLKNEGYCFATVDDIAAYVRGEKTLPRKTAAITFDDGYKSAYEHAFPVLKKFNIPATVFLVGDFEGSKGQRGTAAAGLSPHDIAEMKSSGLVRFGYHSRTHRMLDSLPTKDILDELRGGDYNHKYFAYPGGHHAEAVRTEVRATGYEAAFGIGGGVVRPGDDSFLVGRNVILGTMSDFDFKVRVTKTIDWYMAIVRVFKSKKHK